MNKDSSVLQTLALEMFSVSEHLLLTVITVVIVKDICTSGSYELAPVYFTHLRLSATSFTSEVLLKTELSGLR